jgi:hypothetical protein
MQGRSMLKNVDSVAGGDAVCGSVVGVVDVVGRERGGRGGNARASHG